MSRPPDGGTQQRRLRKQDLLLASQLARGQAAGAFDELAERADAIALRIARVRAWIADPWIWVPAAAAGGLLVVVARRRLPAWRLLQWGWRAWALWRGAAGYARGSGRGLPSRSIAT